MRTFALMLAVALCGIAQLAIVEAHRSTGATLVALIPLGFAILLVFIAKNVRNWN